jgi:hypothetical protein
VEEVAFLAGQASAEARFFAPQGQPGLEVRLAGLGELAVLEDMCRRGRTNFGTPPGRRLKELATDFAVAPEWVLVAVAGRGQGAGESEAVGFGYTFPLNRRTLPAAASTRRAYFGRLPRRELVEIESAPEDDPPAFLITGTTYLASHPEAEHAIRRTIFARRNSHAPRARRSYLLVPKGSPFERNAAAMGMRRRLTTIHLDGADGPSTSGFWNTASWASSAGRMPRSASPTTVRTPPGSRSMRSSTR